MIAGLPNSGKIITKPILVRKMGFLFAKGAYLLEKTGEVVRGCK
jgi:hypothetical protein